MDCYLVETHRLSEGFGGSDFFTSEAFDTKPTDYFPIWDHPLMMSDNFFHPREPNPGLRS